MAAPRLAHALLLTALMCGVALAQTASRPRGLRGKGGGGDKEDQMRDVADTQRSSRNQREHSFGHQGDSEGDDDEDDYDEYNVYDVEHEGRSSSRSRHHRRSGQDGHNRGNDRHGHRRNDSSRDCDKSREESRNASGQGAHMEDSQTVVSSETQLTTTQIPTNVAWTVMNVTHLELSQTELTETTAKTTTLATRLSTTMTTWPGLLEDLNVSGSLVLEVTDPHAFVEDSTAVSILTDSIADFFNVGTQQVNVSLAAGRRLEMSTASTLHNGSVVCWFAVSTKSISERNNVVSKMDGTSMRDLSARCGENLREHRLQYRGQIQSSNARREHDHGDSQRGHSSSQTAFHDDFNRLDATSTGDRSEASSGTGAGLRSPSDTESSSMHAKILIAAVVSVMLCSALTACCLARLARRMRRLETKVIVIGEWHADKVTEQTDDTILDGKILQGIAIHDLQNVVPGKPVQPALAWTA